MNRPEHDLAGIVNDRLPAGADVTPGQASYEERRRLIANRLGEALEDFGVPWDAQTDENRGIEESAARAAIKVELTREPTEAADMRAVIDMVWRLCRQPDDHLAARVIVLIKNSGMEPF